MLPNSLRSRRPDRRSTHQPLPASYPPPWEPIPPLRLSRRLGRWPLVPWARPLLCSETSPVFCVSASPALWDSQQHTPEKILLCPCPFSALFPAERGSARCPCLLSLPRKLSIGPFSPPPPLRRPALPERSGPRPHRPSCLGLRVLLPLGHFLTRIPGRRSGNLCCFPGCSRLSSLRAVSGLGPVPPQSPFTPRVTCPVSAQRAGDA